MTKQTKNQHPNPQENTLKNHVADMVNHLPDLIYQWVPDNTITFGNISFCNFLGVAHENLRGKSILDFVHPDDLDSLKEHISKLCCDKSQSIISYRMINQRGDERWYQWIDKCILNDDPNEIEFISVGRDITAFKQSELETNHQIEFEQMITKLSINFLTLPLENFDDRINNLLAEIGQYVNVDCAYIILFDYDHQTLSKTHEWCEKDFSPQWQDWQNLPIKTLPWWLLKLQNFEIIQITDFNDLPPEAQAEINLFQTEGIQSALAVPLVNNGQLLGFGGFNTLNIKTNWAQDEITILRLMGGIVSNVIIQKRNQEITDARASHLEKLNRLTLSAIDSNSVDELLKVVAEQMDELIGSDGCFITLWDENNKHVIPVITSIPIIKDDAETHLHPEDILITKSILNEGKPIVAEDVHQSPYINPRLAKLFPTQSLLGLPISANGNNLGAILLVYHDKHKFSQEEITLAQQAASQIAQALLKLHLLERANKSTKEAETLHKAGTIVAASLEPEIAIQCILDQLEGVVPFDSASVQILEEDHLEIKAGKGWPKEYNPVGRQFPVPGDNPNSKVIQTRQPYILNDATEEYDTFEKRTESPIHSWLGVPLIVRDQVIGMLTLDHHQKYFYNNDRVKKLVTAFADQVAISLDNARLYAEERQRVKELDALRATTTDISQELELESLLRAILERATELLNATGGELGLLDKSGQNIQILVTFNMGHYYIGEPIKLGEGLMGHVAKTKQILMIKDYQHWEGRLNTYAKSQIHAAIAAPLIKGRRLLGVIGIMNSDPKRKFTESDEDLMRLFAQQAAIAVENAQLFEERERQARIDLTTGVFNRRGLSEMGQRELDRAQRFHRPLTAIMLDIDNFKKVNDTYGHPVGDLLLQELASRLVDNLRTIDVIARYGGEEFLLILPETDMAGAQEIAERLRASVENTPFTPENLSLSITISLGVAVTEKKNAKLSTLIKHADAAMYDSKRAGRNQVSLCKHKI